MGLGERLARVEEQLRELRQDVGEMNSETLRSRGRLHDLEGTTQAIVMAQRERLRHDRERDRRLELRIQVMTLVIALSSFVVPLILGGRHL